MTFSDLVTKVDDFAWGPIMLILLVGTGVYMSLRNGFPQFRHFAYTMKNTVGKMFDKTEVGEGEISPFQAVTTALAGTVGTGNIVGVTGAIAIGGPGAVFWMWVSALFGMCTKYCEVFLAIKYRERSATGEWVGGPMYYIKNGLGKNWKWLGAIFAVLGALAAFGIGNMTQINSIASSISNCIDAFGGNTAGHTMSIAGQTVPVSYLVIGIIVAVLSAIVLLGGVQRIGSVTEKLVPFMAIVYIIAALVVVFGNIGSIGSCFASIFTGAFTPKAVTGGAVGAMMTAVQKGVARGVFSNEAGLGSAPIAHASSSEKNPVKQGLYGIFEVFMDTIVICTLTSLCVLMGGGFTDWGNNPGAALTTAAFASVWGGKVASTIIAIGLALFAFSTILSWSLYGVRCCEYLFGAKSKTPYLLLFIVVIVIGATLELSLVWNIADALNGLMAIPNLVAVLGLSPVIIKETKAYFAGKEYQDSLKK